MSTTTIHRPRAAAQDRTAHRAESVLLDVVHEHGGAMRSYALLLTGDHAAAQDVVQEALVRAWRHSDELVADRGSVRGWLLTVVRNLVTDAARARAARPQEVDESPTTVPQQHDHADRVVAALTVRDALARLSPEHREALELVHLAELSIEEAAAVLGVPAGTVKSRCHYGLRALRQVLTPAQPGPRPDGGPLVPRARAHAHAHAHDGRGAPAGRGATHRTHRTHHADGTTRRTTVPETPTPRSPHLSPGEHFAPVNGFTMHYTVRGAGPVMLVPASGWGPAVSHLVPLPVLEEHCTVVYFDTRHSGASTGPEQADQYTLQHFTADIDALRVHLGAERVFLAGHSGGGHQVLAYGTEHSDHLLGIIAIDAIVAADDVRTAELLRRIEAKRAEPFYREHPDYVDTAVALMSGGGERRPTIQEVLDATGAFYFHRPELAADAFSRMEFDDTVLAYSQASGFQSENLLPRLSRITVPTLLLYGEDDFQCDPVTQGARAHAAVPTSRLELIAEAGHMPWVEQPAAFAAACSAWFAQVPA
ncbi:alpha/beta fold hydrolase [Kineococcus sp. SYSU DK005]|uniref:alpha/beta fold hydrolase n=1 Tax=Kineococcus sp. SYSU DK005 TaxID=3383126 RepID=UPI003D7D2690